MADMIALLSAVMKPETKTESFAEASANPMPLMNPSRVPEDVSRVYTLIFSVLKVSTGSSGVLGAHAAKASTDPSASIILNFFN